MEQLIVDDRFILSKHLLTFVKELNKIPMQKFFPILLLTLCLACKSTQNNSKKSDDLTACNTTATVKDYTGLDGCRFLLLMENGEKWLAVGAKKLGWKFEDHQKIIFGYKEIQPMASVCMAEQKTVELTCIALAENTGKPNIPECYRTKEPMTVPWMKEIIKKKQVEKVIRYPYSDNFAYLFWTNKKSYVYDCQGFFLCEVQGENLSQCYRTIEGKEQGIMIWEALDQPD